MKAKQPAAIIEGTMASPSSPSVRLTAFEVPVITRTPNGTKNQPNSISTFLKKGTARACASPVGVTNVTAMQARALSKKKADQQRSDRRSRRSEGDIAEQIENLKLIREREKQRVEHSIMSLAASIPRAAVRRCGQAQRRGNPSPSRHRRAARRKAA